jgi:hypothetical protein
MPEDLFGVSPKGVCALQTHNCLQLSSAQNAHQPRTPGLLDDLFDAVRMVWLTRKVSWNVNFNGSITRAGQPHFEMTRCGYLPNFKLQAIIAPEDQAFGGKIREI